VVDYANRPLPDRTWIATGDVHRMNWTDDPENKHDLNFWQPHQEPEGGVPGEPIPPRHWRWPYSASFQLAPAWFDQGQSDWTDPNLGRHAQANHQSRFIPSNVVFQGQPVASTAFPSQKVMWHDYGDWYHNRQARFFGVGYDELTDSARVALLLADGGAAVRSTSDANPGWDPMRPSSNTPSRFAYNPKQWEPPSSRGGPAEPIFAGVYRWTRGGLKGRDFDGTEINTGQR
jgi:hypothetical protein